MKKHFTGLEDKTRGDEWQTWQRNKISNGRRIRMNRGWASMAALSKTSVTGEECVTMSTVKIIFLIDTTTSYLSSLSRLLSVLLRVVQPDSEFSIISAVSAK